MKLEAFKNDMAMYRPINFMNGDVEKEIAITISADGTTFTGTGISEGSYRLTETKVPTGYKPIDPIEFTIKATYKEAEPVYELEDLIGGVPGGEITFEKDEDAETLTADVINPDIPELKKEVWKVDSWEKCAGYGIGDEVPFKLTATLAEDVTGYKKYHITFVDQMDKSLTFKEINKVTVKGEEISSTDYTFTKIDDQNFTLRIDWAGEGDANIADKELNGAIAEVYFTAILNEKAKIGSEGNVNTGKLIFSNNPKSEDDHEEGETPEDKVIVFTFKERSVQIPKSTILCLR